MADGKYHVPQISTASSPAIQSQCCPSSCSPVHKPRMGWFSWGNKNQEISEPSRQNRQKCWETRDSYFDCLDRANIIKPGDEGNSCAKEKQLYEDNCAKSWVRLRSAHVYAHFYSKFFVVLYPDHIFQPTTSPRRRAKR